MSGPGRIVSEHNAGGIWGRLSNFETGQSAIKVEHQTFLKHKVRPILLAGGSLRIIGLASRLGRLHENDDLSRRRANAVIAYLRAEAGSTFQVTRDDAEGEQAAERAGIADGDNEEIWRSVIFSAWNHPTPPPTIPRIWTPPPPQFHDPDGAPTPHWVAARFRIRLVGQGSFLFIAAAVFQVHDIEADTTAFFEMRGAGGDLVPSPIGGTTGGTWSHEFIPRAPHRVVLEDFAGRALMTGASSPPAYAPGYPAPSVTTLHLWSRLSTNGFLPLDIVPFPTGMTVPASVGACGGFLFMNPSRTFPFPGPPQYR